jgi:hypothetical protein
MVNKSLSSIPDSRLSLNEIKDLLELYITPFKEMVIKFNTKKHMKISKTKAINILIATLNKEQLSDLLNQLQLINKKRWSDTIYLKYILTGLLFTEVEKFKLEA